MNKKVNRILKSILLVLLVTTFTTGCKEENKEDPQHNKPIEVTLPGSLDIVKGQDAVLQQKGGGVTTADQVYLEINGQSTVCQITHADETSFSFKVPASLPAGTYRLYIKQGTTKKFIGNIIINFTSKQIDIEPGTTVYGCIETADGKPVQGIVVSDGEICTVTDAEGVYQLKSEKTQGVVFYSVPSGYEPETNGVFPKIYDKLALSKNLPENHSFTVKKVANQDNFKILFFGDMHLANRYGDLGAFKYFTEDVNSYKATNSSQKIYGITLGDMTWDAYWKNGYELPSYVSTINDGIKNLTIYHTIGNHDHDPKSIASNLDATNPFRGNIAPAWYSFNIGKVHFIVMDNIDCSPYDGVKDRPYTQGMYGVQHDWLVKDLSYVDMSTPVYIMTHGSIFTYNTTTPDAYKMRTEYGYEKTMSLLAGREVHFVNAHLHQQHTVLPKDVPANSYSHPVYEHNIPAVCADWWYSEYYTKGVHVCTDGTPAGYAIFDFTGKDVKWTYKGTRRSEQELFRVYDMNNVDFTYKLSSFVNLKDASVINEFNKRYVAPYADGKFKNQVMINVWNWNSDSKIEVKTKDGQTLIPVRYRAYDPLSILAMTIHYWDRSALTSVPGTGTSQRYHFFTVKCPDADTDIVVTVTDKFGNKQTQEIARPYTFNADQYKVK